MGNPIWRRGLDFAGHKDAAKSFRRESRDVAESRPIPTGGVVRVFQKEPCLRRSGLAAERQNGKRLAAIVVNSMAVSWGHVSRRRCIPRRSPRFSRLWNSSGNFVVLTFPPVSFPSSPAPWFSSTVDDEDAHADQSMERLLPGFRSSSLTEKYATCAFSYWSNNHNSLREYF